MEIWRPAVHDKKHWDFNKLSNKIWLDVIETSAKIVLELRMSIGRANMDGKGEDSWSHFVSKIEWQDGIDPSGTVLVVLGCVGFRGVGCCAWLTWIGRDICERENWAKCLGDCEVKGVVARRNARWSLWRCVCRDAPGEGWG
jgi:hypothetical protein